MPRVKKAPPPKASKIPAKKKSAKVQIDAKLRQSFLASLANLETFWAKKSAALKKEVDVLRNKSDKTSSKGRKSAPLTKAQLRQAALLQESLTKAKEDLAQAKSASSKYTSLNKLISQFERDWEKTSEPSNKKAKTSTKTAKDAKATKTTKEAKKVSGKKARKTTSQPEHLEEREEKAISNKKPVRKPKVQKVKVAIPFVPEEEPQDLLADEMEPLEDSFEDINEIYTSLEDPLDDALSELEMAEESEDFLEDDSFED